MSSSVCAVPARADGPPPIDLPAAACASTGTTTDVLLVIATNASAACGGIGGSPGVSVTRPLRDR